LLYKSRLFGEAATAACKCRGTAPKTPLDVSYQVRVRSDLLRIEKRMKIVGKRLTNANMSMALREARAAIARVTDLINCKPGHEGVGEKGWRMQCQVQLYMWLGLLKDYRAYKTGLPLGYDEQCVADLTPPRALLYRESSVFELRCYLFMAKNLLASNSTGFSDPIARVLLDNVLLETFVIHDTMSPMWDLTLIRSSVTFNHCPEGVKMNPPHIIVEFFDIDGSSDALEDSPDIPDYDELLDFTRRFNEHILLGPTCGIPFSDDEEDDEEMEIENTEVQTSTRFEDEMAKANQLLDEEAMANLDAPLDDIMSAADTRSVISTTSGATARRVARRKKQQGRTVKYGLATPDLVRWRAETDLRVPEAIRPPLGRFRLEVVFWGVRELRRQFLLPVNRPIITVEVGGTRVVSDLMQNAKVNPLFEHHLKYVDLNLPLDDQYWPPITIMCHDYRMFGVRITVGLCTLPVATDFFEKTALGEY
uniref:C2 domain-containing protein n=1 Tax=Schistocephalus solidus TaxID=70667 RepID=A0A183TBV1_SCHSO